MRFPTSGGLRRRLSYANVMATLAFFFALTGASVAGVKYIAASDAIPAVSDLAGSTYGDPLIADGRVTAAKIADGAITSAKFDNAATAPHASAIGGLDVTTATGSIENVLQGPPYYGIGDFTVTCPGDRIAFDPHVAATTGTFAQAPGFSRSGDLQSYTFVVDFTGSYPNAASGRVRCFGSS
jgi:hypothetical protein